MLNFWATWCPPCRTELPGFQRASDERPDIRFLGLDEGFVAEESVTFLDEVGVTYEQFVDEGGELAAELEITELPATVVLDADGAIAFRRAGRCPTRTWPPSSTTTSADGNGDSGATARPPVAGSGRKNAVRLQSWRWRGRGAAGRRGRRRCVAVERDVVPRPVEQHVGPVAEADEVDEVQPEPGEPAEQPGQAHAVGQLGDGVVAPDRRHRARSSSGTAPSARRRQAADDLLGGMAATLDGHLGDLRQDRRAIRPGDGGRGRGGDVADDEHVGMTRHREVGTDDDVRPW